MSKIQLKAMDGEPLFVDEEIACCSEVIKTMVGDTCDMEDDDSPVLLERVNHATLKKIIEWMTYHKNNPPPAKDDIDKEDRTEEIRAWDAEFLKFDTAMLIDVFNAANYLNIKELLELCSSAIANMIKGKAPEEIRTKFDIFNRPEQLTDGEEECSEGK